MVIPVDATQAKLFFQIDTEVYFVEDGKEVGRLRMPRTGAASLRPQPAKRPSSQSGITYRSEAHATFLHRVSAAFLAISLRRRGVSFAARAKPPFWPKRDAERSTASFLKVMNPKTRRGVTIEFSANARRRASRHASQRAIA